MIVVSVANGILLFGYGLSLPFFTIYLITKLHLAPALAGLVIALAGLSRCVSSAISGELADTFGRKAVMMWGLFSQIIAMFALTTAKSTCKKKTVNSFGNAQTAETQTKLK